MSITINTSPSNISYRGSLNKIRDMKTAEEHFLEFTKTTSVTSGSEEIAISFAKRYAKAKLEEAAEEKEMYKQCFEMFIPTDKWDEATEFLSTNGGKLPKDFLTKNNQQQKKNGVG